MDCITRFGLVTVLGLGSLAGCSKSSPSATKQTDPATKPIIEAAADFLDAVIKGDTQRASSRLTPQAIQRIIASGKQFAPPGLETASYTIGEVRAPSPDQAIVQCVLTDTSSGTPQSEEMCCLLRRVENDWRISGIAYGTSPDQPWMLSDFETGQSSSIPRQTTPVQTAAAPAANGATDVAPRPSPSLPRTAQEAPPSNLR